MQAPSRRNVNLHPVSSGCPLENLNERIIMMQQPANLFVVKTRWRSLLLLGLCLSGILLLSALLVAWRTVYHINSHTQDFAARETTAKASIDGIEQQQADLNNRWLQLARKKDTVRREEILDELAQNRQQMSASLESAYAQAELLRESIYQEGHGLLRWTVWLFAACVALSLACALLVVRASTALFLRLEHQAADLTQLQYQFLESQENAARRFSHELHDELGQVLTAVKANLSALGCGPEEAPRVNDCMHLVDQAIHDVREMSQLLRPTILDDFGLDAALRSLTESFSQRTGIAVAYRSGLDGVRLGDQVETNLFRIAQESLTNVARHAQAISVSMDLKTHGKEVVLAIRDNGKGFDLSARASGLGLAGMQTRAQACGGTLKMETALGKGLAIEVKCPAGL
jgi:signal transduction histidine kinase